MDFSLTTLFVVPSGTLASSGSTQNLTGGQLGVFRPDWSIATVGNIAAAKYFVIAQGRTEQVPGLGSKQSDKIVAARVVDWYKVTAISNAATQQTSVASWSIDCDQQVTVTFVIHSSYIDTGFFNGYTRSVVVKSPCCACGANPCTDISGTALDGVIDQLVAKINFVPANETGPVTSGSSLGRFITASRFGSSPSAQLIITEKPLDIYGNPCEFDAFPYEYDRMWFRTFITNGPFTTQDLQVYDSCNIAGVATITQRSAYQTGTSAELKQLEKNLYSYQTSQFKSTYKQNAWNQAFQSYVVDGTFYDTYYIKYYAYDDHQTSWNPAVLMDYTVILAFPTTTGSTFETLMTAVLGAPTDQSGTNPTTTTTTSTTSTSTSSTTTLIP